MENLELDFKQCEYDDRRAVDGIELRLVARIGDNVVLRSTNISGQSLNDNIPTIGKVVEILDILSSPNHVSYVRLQLYCNHSEIPCCCHGEFHSDSRERFIANRWLIVSQSEIRGFCSVFSSFQLAHLASLALPPRCYVSEGVSTITASLSVRSTCQCQICLSRRLCDRATTFLKPTGEYFCRFSIDLESRTLSAAPDVIAAQKSVCDLDLSDYPIALFQCEAKMTHWRSFILDELHSADVLSICNERKLKQLAEYNAAVNSHSIPLTISSVSAMKVSTSTCAKTNITSLGSALLSSNSGLVSYLSRATSMDQSAVVSLSDTVVQRESFFINDLISVPNSTESDDDLVVVHHSIHVKPKRVYGNASRAQGQHRVDSTCYPPDGTTCHICTKPYSAARQLHRPTPGLAEALMAEVVVAYSDKPSKQCDPNTSPLVDKTGYLTRKPSFSKTGESLSVRVKRPAPTTIVAPVNVHSRPHCSNSTTTSSTASIRSLSAKSRRTLPCLHASQTQRDVSLRNVAVDCALARPMIKPACHHWFCRVCCRKYWHVDASDVSWGTVQWACPVCTFQCLCETCLNPGVKPLDCDQCVSSTIVLPITVETSNVDTDTTVNTVTAVNKTVMSTSLQRMFSDNIYVAESHRLNTVLRMLMASPHAMYLDGLLQPQSVTTTSATSITNAKSKFRRRPTQHYSLKRRLKRHKISLDSSSQLKVTQNTCGAGDTCVDNINTVFTLASLSGRVLLDQPLSPPTTPLGSFANSTSTPTGARLSDSRKCLEPYLDVDDEVSVPPSGSVAALPWRRVELARIGHPPLLFSEVMLKRYRAHYNGPVGVASGVSPQNNAGMSTLEFVAYVRKYFLQFICYASGKSSSNFCDSGSLHDIIDRVALSLSEPCGIVMPPISAQGELVSSLTKSEFKLSYMPLSQVLGNWSLLERMSLLKMVSDLASLFDILSTGYLHFDIGSLKSESAVTSSSSIHSDADLRFLESFLLPATDSNTTESQFSSDRAESRSAISAISLLSTNTSHCSSHLISSAKSPSFGLAACSKRVSPLSHCSKHLTFSSPQLGCDSLMNTTSFNHDVNLLNVSDIVSGFSKTNLKRHSMMDTFSAHAVEPSFKKKCAKISRQMSTGVRLVAACPIQKPLSQFPWFATQSCINNHVDTSDPCSCSVDLTLHQSYVARRDETWHDYAGLHAVSEGGLMQHRDLQRRTLLLCRRRAYITGGFNVPYM